MVRGQQAAFLTDEQTIHHARAEMLGGYIRLITNLDDERHWDRIVTKAREAGLGKDALRKELSCSWSTITRWMAGHTAPGPFMRQAVKAKLIRMLQDLQAEELSREREMEYA